MALRTFTDSDGVSWQVWDVHPAYPGMIGADLERGWLVFQSGFDKRRLCPIPAEWELCPAEDLDRWRHTARSAHAVAG